MDPAPPAPTAEPTAARTSEAETAQTDELTAFRQTFSTPHVPPNFGSPSFTFTYTPIPSADLILPEGGLHLTCPAPSISQLFAHRQWRAGLRVADAIAEGRVGVRGKRVLELGAGTGLPGILCALRGAELTVMSDYDDEALISCLRANVRKNVPEILRPRAKVVGHIWGESVDEFEHYSPSGFSLILLADVLWNAFSHPSLLSTLTRTLARTSEARILVVSGAHTGREPIARFLRMARARGLVVDEARGVWEEEVAEEQGGTGGRRREWDELREDGDVRERNRWLVEGWLKWEEEKLQG